MVIQTPNPGNIDLGGSRVQSLDSYFRPTPKDSGSDGLNQLKSSLGQLGIAFDQQADNVQESQKARTETYVQNVVQGMQKGEAADVAVGRLHPELSPVVRALVSEGMGRRQAVEDISPELDMMPPELVNDPEGSKAWFNKVRTSAAGRVQGQPFYGAGYLKAVDEQINQRQSVVSAKRSAEWANEMEGSAAQDLVDRGRSSLSPLSTPTETDSRHTVPGFTNTPGAVVPAFSARNAPDPLRANAVLTSAAELGVNPIDLATVISYETGGKFDPDIVGGKNNAHMGLIQFGTEERKKYGITKGMSFGDQMKAVVSFLKDRGFKPGMSIVDLYSTINAGTPGKRNASDGNGTVASHVDTMMKEHRKGAMAFLGTGGQPANVQVASNGPIALPAPVFDDEDEDGPIPSDALALRTALTQGDEDWANMSPLTRSHRRDLMVKAAVALAWERKDPDLLRAIPAELQNPETADLLRKQGEMITTQKLSDYSRKKQVEKQEKDDWQSGQVDGWLTAAAKTKPGSSMPDIREFAVNPRTGQLDYEVYTKLLPLMNQGLVPEVDSSAAAAKLESNVYAAATSGNWSALGFKGTPTDAQIVDLIRNSSGMSPRDKTVLMGKVAEMQKGAFAASSPDVQDVFQMGAGRTVSNTMSNSAFAGIVKLMRPDVAADTAGIFNSAIQAGIRAHIADTGNVPKGAALQAIAQAANLQASTYFEAEWNRIVKVQPADKGTAPPTTPAKPKFRTLPDGTKELIP